MGIGDSLSRIGSSPGKVAGIFATFLVAGLLVVLIVRESGSSAADCSGELAVTVGADPSIAPAVREIAEASDAVVDGQCVVPRVVPVPAAAVVHGRGAERADAGDLWIPDSRAWLDEAERSAGLELEDEVSLASSPVVLATTEETARAAGWPDSRPSWSQLLSGTAVTGASAPSDGTSTLFALAGMDQLGGSEQDRARLVVAMARNTFADGDDPFDHLPGGAARPTVATFPTSERAVIRHNTEVRGASLVAVYPDKPVPWLDYPAAVVADPASATAAAARGFRNALQTEQAREVFERWGLRTPKGELSGSAAADTRYRADAGTAAPLPDTTTAGRLLQQWATLSSTARLIVALDMSGSMQAPAPGTGKSRFELAAAAIGDGMRLLRPDSRVALWEFSTDATGKQEPVRTVVDWKSVREHVAQQSTRALAGHRPQKRAATPLYDTVLAAVRESQRQWDPGALNLVVVLTDGYNNFAPGLTRRQLIDQLKGMVSAEKPTPVIFVGFGTAVDPAALRAIADVTGGQVHVSKGVEQIRDVFLATLRGLAAGR